MKKTLVEALGVALLGATLSLLANQVSPRGLTLSRDYFPAGSAVDRPAIPTVPKSGVLGTTNTTSRTGAVSTVPGSAMETLAARLRAKGLTLVGSNQVIAWFDDPSYRNERIIFLDARDDERYQGGHIPAAYQLDYYRPEQYLPTVLQAGQGAEKIVIYCTGGHCEDSELAAQMLATAFPPEKLFIYAGGINEWSSNSLPVEMGARNSGALRNTATK